MIASLIKVFIPTVLGFFVGIGITPVLTKMMYKYQLWKKVSRSDDENENMSSFQTDPQRTQGRLREKYSTSWRDHYLGINTYYNRTCISYFNLYPISVSDKLNFLSRNQTLVPLAALIFGALLGLADDALQILGLGKRLTMFAIDT